MCETDFVLFEYAQTYMACFARVLSQLQMKDEDYKVLPPDHQALLQSSILLLITLSEDQISDETVITIEELLIVVLSSNETLFFQQVNLIQALSL